MSVFEENLHEQISLLRRISSLDGEVSKAVALITQAMSCGRKLILCGNGGSAADCQHLAAEFTGKFTLDRKPLPALALTTDTSALTCIANDYDFNNVFARQILALGAAGDILLAISTSGNSENVLKAIEIANDMNITTIGLSGNDGGRMAYVTDVNIIVPSHTTARIQEAHILIGHTICGNVEQNLGLITKL